MHDPTIYLFDRQEVRLTYTDINMDIHVGYL